MAGYSLFVVFDAGLTKVLVKRKLNATSDRVGVVVMRI